MNFLKETGYALYVRKISTVQNTFGQIEYRENMLFLIITNTEMNVNEIFFIFKTYNFIITARCINTRKTSPSGFTLKFIFFPVTGCIKERETAHSPREVFSVTFPYVSLKSSAKPSHFSLYLRSPKRGIPA